MTANNFPDFLERPVDEVAARLLGCVFERDIDGRTVRLRIVETEAYDQEDEASHTFRGETKRNATMFGAAGYMYVYFTYGMHYCCNVVTGRAGHGSGVLIRAAEPLDNNDFLESRRRATGVNITNGPAKLCQALGVDVTMNGHDLRLAPMRLIAGELGKNETVVMSPRIGISKAKDIHRRFFIKDNPYVSRTK
jgi:DNA-3-methyladenine glycosylase